MKKKTALVALALFIGSFVIPVQANAFEEGNFLVRVRGIVVKPDESGSLNPIGGDLQVSTTYTPEADFSYFFTKNISVELIAAITQHSLSASKTSIGNIDLGKTKVLPPTLLAQYHFFSDEMISPYVGVGFNYTFFFDTTDGPVADSVKIDNAYGPAFQLGFDLQFPNSNFVFNADAKFILLSPDVKARAGSTQIDSRNFDLNPWIFGFGFGYKF
ncbi:MAG: OmpW family outer membrane protein [Rhodospirillales bacterium]